jgi:hypothetical protein
LLLIDEEQNPKALGLFLMALVKLNQKGLLSNNNLIPEIVQRIKALRSTGTDYWCWGYSFPWQTRTIIVPKAYPNLVCTTFVANALLDLYEASDPAASNCIISDIPETLSTDCLQMAVNAAEYVLNELYWSKDDACGFSYPLPLLNNRVHNANFLGAALLCRAYRLSGERSFLEPALKAARYSASQQHDDGSWDYGEHSTQQWVDNFHTGYNLCALKSIGKNANTSEFESNVERGFRFYINHFFAVNGAPKYFHNRVFPVDIHSVAQSIVTLLSFTELDKANIRRSYEVCEYACTHMLDDQGYFYYQVHPHFTNKISYMRWSQAWMLLALATILERPKH